MIFFSELKMLQISWPSMLLLAFEILEFIKAAN